MSDWPPYQRYAGIYDATGQDAFSRRAWDRVRGLLARHQVPVRDALDLACGTAAAVADMAADGLHAIGLDLSRPMLLEGRAGPVEPLPDLVRGDMRRLPFAAGSFDLVTSFYDSLNYLTGSSGLTQVAAEAARVLRPGGALAFDLNTPHTLKVNWNGLCSAREEEDRASIWRAVWLERSAVSSLRATFFVRADDGRYVRFDEVHDERGFSDQQVDRALREAGLTSFHSEDMSTGRRPSSHSTRILYLARKNP